MSKWIKIASFSLATLSFVGSTQPAQATHVDLCTALAQSACSDPAVAAKYPYYTACVIAQESDCGSSGGGVGGTGEGPLPPGNPPLCWGQGASGGEGCPDD